MIPVEDKINEWTSFSNHNHPLHVRYVGTPVAGTNLGARITLSVWAPQGLPNKLAPRDEADAIELSFWPQSDRVFDGLERRLYTHEMSELES